MANTFFIDELTQRSIRKQENESCDLQFSYPFHGTLHQDHLTVNHDLVKFPRRTQRDFENPSKLTDPLKPPPKSLTGYETYLTGEKKAKTQGLF
jgi:hypothetical protein